MSCGCPPGRLPIICLLFSVSMLLHLVLCHDTRSRCLGPIRVHVPVLCRRLGRDLCLARCAVGRGLGVRRRGRGTSGTAGAPIQVQSRGRCGALCGPRCPPIGLGATLLHVSPLWGGLRLMHPRDRYACPLLIRRGQILAIPARRCQCGSVLQVPRAMQLPPA